MEMFYKDDLSNDFNNVSLKTIKLEEGEDTLVDLGEIVRDEYFFNYLEEINRCDNHFLYYRGACLNRYNIFATHLLSGNSSNVKNIFVTGEKSSIYKKRSGKSSHETERSADSENIERMMNKIDDKTRDLKKELIIGTNKEKMETLLSIIHILGENYFPQLKKDSPYVSVAVGDGNYGDAKEFQTFSNDNEGFILMGYNAKDQRIIETKLYKKYSSHVEDITENINEVLIKDVLMPTSLIGFFVFKTPLSGDRQKIFIVNPWLAKKLHYIEKAEENDGHVCIDGISYSSSSLKNIKIPIDQSDFHIINRSSGNEIYIIENENISKPNNLI
ncbi:hypothetical protein [Salinicoccus roseus]|uniref:hypothetical protein n=1 Tax=Salinicoccus roseus TaxID=45670 RepID=UPI0023008D3B|nr:hypothetical protein [Salinicoccus roseus]